MTCCAAPPVTRPWHDGVGERKATKETKQTFCRICEPLCPMVAEIDANGRVVNLSPGVGHPSGSTPCHKGLGFVDVHNDPDRLDWPQKRLNRRDEARG